MQKEKSVLLVVSDSAHREQLLKTFAGCDVNLFITCRGEEAVRICRQNEDISIAFIDLMLNGYTGFETMHEIRKLRQQMKTIAIVDDLFQKEIAHRKGFLKSVMLPVESASILDELRSGMVS